MGSFASFYRLLSAFAVRGHVGNAIHAFPTVSRLALLCVSAALLLGGVVRLRALGNPVLALDEYYFLVSVRSIVEGGLPELPGGGYYQRAPIVQYFAAATARIVGDPLYGLRLGTVILGIASIVAAFFYARRLVGVTLAAALTLVLSVSSWEIELSRFGRMYAGFQLAALLFFWMFHEVLARRARSPYLLLPLALLVMGTHELGVFFLPLLFVPFAVPPIRENLTRRALWTYLGGAGVVLALGFVFYQFDGRSIGIASPFPDGTSPPPVTAASLRGVGAPFIAPGVISSAGILVSLAAGAGIAMMWVWVRKRDARLSVGSGLAAGIVVAGLFHQLAIVVLLASLLFARYRVLVMDRENRRLLVASLAGCVMSILWLGLAAVMTYVGENRSWLTTLDAGSFAGGIRRAFLGVPDFYIMLVEPYGRAVPLLALSLGLACVYEFSRLARRPAREVVGDPLFMIGYFAIVISSFNAPAISSRYTHFLYPLALLILLRAIYHALGTVGSRWLVKGEARTAGATVGFLALFVMGGDFNWRHLASPESPDAAFRMGEFEKFEIHWTPRWDNRSPAEYLHGRGTGAGGSSHVVVAADTPPFSYYYRAPHLIYVPRSGQRFWTVSRQGGTVDLWSGRRLVSTHDELRAATSEATTVWVVTRVDHRPVIPQEVWRECVADANRVFLSQDSRIEVVRVQLNRDSKGCVTR